MNQELKHGMTWFDTVFKNLIEFVPFGANPFLGTYQNIAVAQIQGVEAFVTKECGDNLYRINTSYTSPKDVAGKIDLRRRARWSSTFQWERSMGKDTLLTRVKYKGKVNESNTIVDELDSYVTIDLNYLMPINDEKFSLNVGVDNVFDKHYEVARSYGIPGRVYWVKLGTRF